MTTVKKYLENFLCLYANGVRIEKVEKKLGDGRYYELFRCSSSRGPNKDSTNGARFGTDSQFLPFLNEMEIESTIPNELGKLMKEHQIQFTLVDELSPKKVGQYPVALYYRVGKLTSKVLT